MRLKVKRMNSTIDHLPPEILRYLLGFLSLSELIEKKLVCKLWNELISSQLKVTRLAVERYARKKERWWYVSQPVDEYLEVCHPHLFAAQLHRPILANLKHLRIESDDFEPNHLNAFAQLVHLEVYYYSIFPNTKIEWSLPNLKILKFR